MDGHKSIFYCIFKFCIKFDFILYFLFFRSDYYRKFGAAMVPVRWMPPESILEGYFSAASDVWYEIQSIITNERNLYFATSIVTHKHKTIKRIRKKLANTTRNKK